MNYEIDAGLRISRRLDKDLLLKLICKASSRQRSLDPEVKDQNVRVMGSVPLIRELGESDSQKQCPPKIQE
jgi:hypothetical protein